MSRQEKGDRLAWLVTVGWSVFLTTAAIALYLRQSVEGDVDPNNLKFAVVGSLIIGVCVALESVMFYTKYGRWPWRT